MKNILIIGGGGIGSWLVTRLHRLNEYGQLPDTTLTIADNDEVEDKNLPYQNFDINDIMDFKVESLSSRFNCLPNLERIKEDKDLESFNIIISAVDNSPTRRLVYKHCYENNKYFIDLRSEGSAIWTITADSNWTFDQLNATLDNSNEDRSCQLSYELESNIIQLGNTIVAEIGAQYLLNHLRGKKNPSKPFSQRF